eukprot:1541487-Rhodomonas_salina.1
MQCRRVRTNDRLSCYAHAVQHALQIHMPSLQSAAHSAYQSDAPSYELPCTLLRAAYAQSGIDVGCSGTRRRGIDRQRSNPLGSSACHVTAAPA